MVPPSQQPGNRRLWLAYGASCVLAWGLYVLAGTGFDRGLDPVWLAIYQATTMLWAPMLLGLLIWPLTRSVHASGWSSGAVLLAHGLGALGFTLAWLGADYGFNTVLFGAAHANATLAAGVPWRLVAGTSVYAAMAVAFNAVLQGRQARRAAVAAAQAEAALARAELAAVTAKLNPHFLFNTLNTLIALTRKDARAAEAALMRFSGLLRYVLDTQRGRAHPPGSAGVAPAAGPGDGLAGVAQDRVSLQEELAFVRDYLALEALRLGPRLRVNWQLDDEVLDDALPPLTLQPLVENAIVHAVAPRRDGGSVRISARRDRLHQGLDLTVADDGPGCDPVALEPPPGARRGIGLAALRKRFALDYDGRARLQVQTAPGAGFRVDLWIPQS